MAELYWPNDSSFVDYQTDTRYEGEGLYEVEDRLVDFYVTRGWKEDAPEDFDGEVRQPTGAVDTNRDSPRRDELVGGGDSGN